MDGGCNDIYDDPDKLLTELPSDADMSSRDVREPLNGLEMPCYQAFKTCDDKAYEKKDGRERCLTGDIYHNE